MHSLSARWKQPLAASAWPWKASSGLQKSQCTAGTGNAHLGAFLHLGLQRFHVDSRHCCPKTRCKGLASSVPQFVARCEEHCLSAFGFARAILRSDPKRPWKQGLLLMAPHEINYLLLLFLLMLTARIHSKCKGMGKFNNELGSCFFNTS